MIKIKIAKESIKKNPNAFSTRTLVHTNKEVTVSGHGKNIPVILNYNNFHLTEREMGNFGLNKWKGYLIDDTIIDKLNKANCQVEVKFDHEFIEHAPLPEFLFEYENTDIECPECKGVFKSNDFESDIDDDDENYCDTICPLCKHWIDGVEYERIQDVKTS
jgi:hypothetical protein